MWYVNHSQLAIQLTTNNRFILTMWYVNKKLTCAAPKEVAVLY